MLHGRMAAHAGACPPSCMAPGPSLRFACAFMTAASLRPAYMYIFCDCMNLQLQAAAAALLLSDALETGCERGVSD